MSESATRMVTESATARPATTYIDPLIEFLIYLRVILPLGAIHTVTIRRHHDPASKDTWVISPGSFHVRRGDLIYWSMAENSGEIQFTDTSLMGVSKLTVPYGGTGMGSVRGDAPLGTQIYKVVLETGSAVPDEGMDPTIIVDG